MIDRKVAARRAWRFVRTAPTSATTCSTTRSRSHGGRNSCDALQCLRRFPDPADKRSLRDALGLFGRAVFFQDKEISLLEEAAANVSFGLDNFAADESAPPRGKDAPQRKRILRYDDREHAGHSLFL